LDATHVRLPNSQIKMHNTKVTRMSTNDIIML
jgi:hypothetical protein